MAETLNDMTLEQLEELAKRVERTKAEKAAVSGNAVVVTTAHRGVFFGYADDTTGETITLRNARNCLYWSEDVKGFLGLSATGPTSGCRIGNATPTLTLRNITAVAPCTAVAVAAWERAPWKK